MPVATTEEIKQQQRDEVARLQGEVSEEEKERVAKAKQQLLEEFWKQ